MQTKGIGAYAYAVCTLNDDLAVCRNRALMQAGVDNFGVVLVLLDGMDLFFIWKTQ